MTPSYTAAQCSQRTIGAVTIADCRYAQVATRKLLHTVTWLTLRIETKSVEGTLIKSIWHSRPLPKFRTYNCKCVTLCTKSTHLGVTERSKDDVTQTQQQRHESRTVILSWHARKYKVHKGKKKHEKYKVHKGT